jgi:hypothetical protein
MFVFSPLVSRNRAHLARVSNAHANLIYGRDELHTVSPPLCSPKSLRRHLVVYFFAAAEWASMRGERQLTPDARASIVIAAR